MTDFRLLTQQVKEANDIVDVVGSYVSLRPRGGTHLGLCPFHDDSRPSFDVDSRRQRYRCWACGKYGDVISFIQEFERVDFREALEMLARRAGISLEKKADSPQQRGRALMLDIMTWAAAAFHECLLDDPVAEAARRYLGERRLLGETVRRFGLGFAPPAGDWLLRKAAAEAKDLELLEQVGLVARRQHGPGFYDRFRDRVMFPIRDPLGKTVGFGGRILPSSPLSARAPKYYNSADTPLFSKSQNLYGIDLARHAAGKVGYLAVVEGYTDVLMAHQLGVPQVVATMGTALNEQHVRQLRRFAGRVVLVFDADEGGDKGVDRALEIFASQDVDLQVATLPAGLDPCDLLVQQGAEPFRAALANAVDALDYKLDGVLRAPEARTVEGRRLATDAVLGTIARAPELAGEAGQVKQELIVTRIAQRLGINHETVWRRLRELRQARREDGGREEPPTEVRRPTPEAAPHERELLQVLLADPTLVSTAYTQVRPEEIAHPGVRQLVAALYGLHEAGQSPDFDLLRPTLANPRVVARALEMQEIGLRHLNRPEWLKQILVVFRDLRGRSENQELHSRLRNADDHGEALRLLEALQKRTAPPDAQAG